MAEKKPKIRIRLGDHFGVFGGTGTGKTFFATQLVITLANATRGKVRVFIIDSKQYGDFDMFIKKGVGVAYKGQDLPPMENKDGSPFIVWQPLYDDKQMYDDFFTSIYVHAKQTKQPCIVFIDELSSISGNQYPPNGLKILLKQGRGMGISVLALSQVARLLPMEVTSQLMHSFKFNLNAKEDKKKLKDLFGDSAEENVLHKRGFFYRNVNEPIQSKKGKPYYYKNAQEFFGLE